VFVAMITNQYKSSPAISHGTRTESLAHDSTTIYSLSENKNIRHLG